MLRRLAYTLLVLAMGAVTLGPVTALAIPVAQTKWLGTGDFLASSGNTVQYIGHPGAGYHYVETEWKWDSGEDAVFRDSNLQSWDIR